MSINKIVVDRNLCIGAASCVVVADKIFELDAENKAVFKIKGGSKSPGPVVRKDSEDSSTDDETILLAAKSCPTKAVFIYDENGKQIYPVAF